MAALWALLEAVAGLCLDIVWAPMALLELTGLIGPEDNPWGRTAVAFVVLLLVWVTLGGFVGSRARRLARRLRDPIVPWLVRGETADRMRAITRAGYRLATTLYGASRHIDLREAPAETLGWRSPVAASANLRQQRQRGFIRLLLRLADLARLGLAWLAGVLHGVFRSWFMVLVIVTIVWRVWQPVLTSFASLWEKVQAELTPGLAVTWTTLIGLAVAYVSGAKRKGRMAWRVSRFQRAYDLLDQLAVEAGHAHAALQDVVDRFGETAQGLVEARLRDVTGGAAGLNEMGQVVLGQGVAGSADEGGTRSAGSAVTPGPAAMAPTTLEAEPASAYARLIAALVELRDALATSADDRLDDDVLGLAPVTARPLLLVLPSWAAPGAPPSAEPAPDKPILDLRGLPELDPAAVAAKLDDLGSRWERLDDAALADLRARVRQVQKWQHAAEVEGLWLLEGLGSLARANIKHRRPGPLGMVADLFGGR
ncbi:MAG: hypothetical protein LBR33_03855 [Propionibacteriaceae bacterium]|nr:hypothetical protein [Propionibacteriaceae bacterium]